MPIHYKEIPGWFHAEELYKLVIDTFKEPSIFVEIGSYIGKSGCYMAELIKENNRPIDFYMLDHWMWDLYLFTEEKKFYEGNETLRLEHNRVVKEEGPGMYKIIQYYLKKFNLIDNVKLIKGLSQDSVNIFKDNSIDFLYIDGDHKYNGVKSDISLYLPKMKSGGIISGDDYGVSGSDVAQVTKELLGDVSFIGNKVTWFKRI